MFLSGTFRPWLTGWLKLQIGGLLYYFSTSWPLSPLLEHSVWQDRKQTHSSSAAHPTQWLSWGRATVSLNQELHQLLFHGAPFLLQGMPDKQWLFRHENSFGRHFPKKWTKWACHFKENNWHYVLPMLKPELLTEN